MGSLWFLFCGFLLNVFSALKYFSLSLKNSALFETWLGRLDQQVEVGRDDPLLVGAHKTAAAVGFGMVEEATDGMGYDVVFWPLVV